MTPIDRRLSEFCALEAFKGMMDESSRRVLLDPRRLSIPNRDARRSEMQDDLVALACAEPTGRFLIEAPPGFGKSRVLGKISAGHARRGIATLLVCHGETTFDSLKAQFAMMFSDDGLDQSRIGRLNVLDKTSLVNFLSPGALVGARASGTPLFSQVARGCGLMLVDEAHHFPEHEEAARMAHYRQIDEVAVEHFGGGKVVGVTATAYRLEGMSVLGKFGPDARITIQSMVDVGLCPEIFGFQAFLDIECDAELRGDTYSLRFSEEDEETYFQQITDRMIEVFKRFPRPTCVFAREVRDADRLVRMFNEKSGLGDRGLRLLTGNRPDGSAITLAERRETIEAIRGSTAALYEGRVEDCACLGYATCHVGEESLDIEGMMVCHLVRRTRSTSRNVQAVGRCLRPWAGKGHAIVVDYHLAKKKLIKACVGLPELALAAGTRYDHSRIGSGGAGYLVGREERKASYGGMSFSDQQDWITKTLPLEDRLKIRDELMRRGLRPAVKSGKRTFEVGETGKLESYTTEKGARIPWEDVK
jgi:superfamily II DNA or RNA helicase